MVSFKCLKVFHQGLDHTFGSPMIAMATHSFRFCPPLSWGDLVCFWSSKSTLFNTSSIYKRRTHTVNLVTKLM